MSQVTGSQTQLVYLTFCTFSSNATLLRSLSSSSTVLPKGMENAMSAVAYLVSDGTLVSFMPYLTRSESFEDPHSFPGEGTLPSGTCFRNIEEYLDGSAPLVESSASCIVSQHVR